MTPEERAQETADLWHGVANGHGLTNRITAAIRAAVAEEREACAKVAETCILYKAFNVSAEKYIENEGRRSIAAAIRARNSDESDPPIVAQRKLRPRPAACPKCGSANIGGHIINVWLYSDPDCELEYFCKTCDHNFSA